MKALSAQKMALGVKLQHALKIKEIVTLLDEVKQMNL